MSARADPHRLDTVLPARGLAASRTQAARLITAGRVLVDGRVVRKPAAPVAPDATVEVTQPERYVSRAAYKLLAALDGFGVDPGGRLALDCGASTGGFTQVLLERAAARVIALDVGHGQFSPVLAVDPRIVLLEGVNARELDAQRLASLTASPERPSLVVADVSFISLTLVLPALRRTALPEADFVVLVKPQFEVGRAAVRGGLVSSRKEQLRAIDGVAAAAAALGLGVAGVLSSPVLGEAGNREFLCHLRRGPGVDRREWEVLALEGQDPTPTGAEP